MGIPFDHKFNVHVDKHKVYQKMGLDEHTPILLIMGGGQGLGPIKTIVKSLDRAHENFQEIIITGTNKKLYKALKKKAKKSKKKIHVLGYVNNINELMSIASLIVTKPGGITTSEALSKHLPMLIIKPIPGQEENNTTFLTEKEAALRIEDPKKIHHMIDELLRDPRRLKHLSDCAGKISKPNASIDIARLVLHLAHG
jgi:processive 1,2-diacylglycerol beta-glucosyltransferase